MHHDGMHRIARAPRRRSGRSFIFFILIQMLIGFIAFLGVRDYMSGGPIRQAMASAWNQIANGDIEKENTNAPVIVAPDPPPATKIVQEQPAPVVQATAEASSQNSAPEAQGQALVSPVVPDPAPLPETAPVVAATPDPAPQANDQFAAPVADPVPAPQAEEQPVPAPQTEEQVVAVAPVPDPAPLNEAPAVVAAAAAPEATNLLQGEGQVFRDCDSCPELVLVGPGRFMMGPGGEGLSQQAHAAAPQEVTITAPFAIGRYEVTFDDWDACVNAGGCTTQPSDDGWGRGRRPVIHVSYNDISEQYLPWLSKVTGHGYRLPTEAEWELASRGGAKGSQRQLSDAGSKAEVACTYGNSSDVAAKTRETMWGGVGCNDGFVYTAPVGSLKPNSLGVFDMHGNVWEWVSDCWHATYDTEEQTNSSSCKYHVLRGGSWASEFRFLPDGIWVGDAVAYRSAVRGWETSVKARNSIGFRVARSQP